MNVKVSIIVPVYNGEQYLKRAIDSVVNQTYTGNYEVLVIDDGSKDGTAAICKEYEEKYPFVHCHYQSNIGISRTRERAVELAQGEFICWIDADDYVSSDLLRVVMGKIEETNADICIFSWQDFYANGKTVDRQRKENSIENWRRQTITGELTNVWSYICKRELWLNEKSPWQVKKSAADAYMTPILFKKAKSIVSVPNILYYYMQDNLSSITHTYSGMRLLGAGYSYYQRFKMSLTDYPDLVDQVGNEALRLLTKAYCVSAYLNDLDKETRELIRSYVLEISEHVKHQPFRNKQQIFFIRNRWSWMVKLAGMKTCKKIEKKNRNIRELTKS